MAKHERILTGQETATRLGVEYVTIWRMLQRGEFPNQVRDGNGRLIGIPESDIIAYLDRQREYESRT